jgi:hypothetical protein
MPTPEREIDQSEPLIEMGALDRETSAPAELAETLRKTSTPDATVTLLSPDLAASEKRRANLHPDAATRHGIGPLTQRGELPDGPDFDLFRDALAARRAEALAWVGGESANTFDRDEAEASARWSTASDLIWGVLFAEGLLTQTRRRKSLVDLAERIDKRASYHREICRARRHEKDVSKMSISDYLASTGEKTA